MGHFPEWVKMRRSLLFPGRLGERGEDQSGIRSLGVSGCQSSHWWRSPRGIWKTWIQGNSHISPLPRSIAIPFLPRAACLRVCSSGIDSWVTSSGAQCCCGQLIPPRRRQCLAHAWRRQGANGVPTGSGNSRALRRGAAKEGAPLTPEPNSSPVLRPLRRRGWWLWVSQAGARDSLRTHPPGGLGHRRPAQRAQGTARGFATLRSPLAAPALLSRPPRF